MYLNLNTQQQLTEQQIRAAHPNTSFPSPFRAPDGYAVLFPAPRPAYEPISQFVREIAPELTVLGNYEQRFEVLDLDPEQVAANQAAADAQQAKRIADKLQALWAAADAYVTGYISGVAIGILTIGVIQSKPKALAITAWSSAVWASYYERKALITADSVDNLDFTALGDMPYSVPELQAEVFG